MSKRKYFHKFILYFFLTKLILISITLLGSKFDIYSYSQAKDIIYIISPGFILCTIIFLNYLHEKPDLEKIVENKVVSKTEMIIIFSGLLFYFIFLLINILSQQAEYSAFILLKSKIAFIEYFVSGLFGWMIISVKNE